MREAQTTDQKTSGSRPDDMSVYARRRTRMVFLRRLVGEDHPVLATERALVGMARSKLREELIVDHGVDGLARVRTLVETGVRDAMMKSVPSLVTDSEGRARLCRDIMQEPLDDLFCQTGS